MEKLSDSVVSQIILREFANEEYNRVVEMVTRYGNEHHHLEENRVRLSILKLANGDLFSLDRQVKVACVDFRDVIAAAEMPGQYKLGFTGMERLSPQELENIKSADRKQYEAWLDKPD